MDTSTITLMLALETVIFLAVVLMHLLRKHTALIGLYALESLAVASILFLIAREDRSIATLVIAFAVLTIKVAIVPWLLRKLLVQSHIPRTSASYLSTPEALLGLLVIAIGVQSFLVPAISEIVSSEGTVFLSLFALFASLLLALSRKGAIAQIIAILSIENSIVIFVAHLGLRTHALLEFGILLDVLVWAFVASAFVGMIKRHFGTADVSIMKQLSE